MVADDDSIFINSIFKNLSVDQSVDQDLRVHDLTLLARYVDYCIFSRIEITRHLNDLINPKRPISNLLNLKQHKYKIGLLDRTREERILHASKILNSPDQRKNFNASLHTAASSVKLIDLTGFYDVRLSQLNDDKLKTTPPDIKTKSDQIKTVLLRWLQMTGKIKRNQVNESNKTYLEEWLYNNISLIRMSLKLGEVIYNALEKLKRPNSTIFSRPFLQLSLDRSQLKVKFHINKKKLTEKTSLKITLPPYVSYKIGSSMPVNSYNPSKLEKIKIGPITLANPQITTLFSNIITSEKQKLFESIRFLPQLLCVKSPILAETGR